MITKYHFFQFNKIWYVNSNPQDPPLFFQFISIGYFVKLKINHISWLMYQFHYMHGNRGSELNWTCTLYHQYSGIGTIIKKYDFFLKFPRQKWWKLEILHKTGLDMSNMHWKCIFKTIIVVSSCWVDCGWVWMLNFQRLN